MIRARVADRPPIYSLAAVDSAILQANLLPPELTAIRAVGLGLAVLIAGFAIWRRRSLRNADVLILLAIALGLAIVSGTELLDAILSAFSFKRSNGTRIVGVAVFAILILFLLVVRALAQGSRITRELSEVLEGLAWEQFRAPATRSSSADRIGCSSPPTTRPRASAGCWIGSRRVCGDRDRGAGCRRRLARRAPATSPPSTAPSSRDT